jgi:D-glycerate 3-kinase
MKTIKGVFRRLGTSSVYSADEVTDIIVPLVRDMLHAHTKGKTTIVGVQGGQGTGKTTLVTFLRDGLRAMGYRVSNFSIDDFYTSYKKRQQLARAYPHNPFYAIPRGMPGTHRVRLLLSVLRKAKAGKPFTIPQFDKSLHRAAGDVLKKRIRITEPQDFILFEGWCLGIPAVSSKEFVAYCMKGKIPLRTLDPELNYHKVVLKFITRYQAIWKLIDYMIMLKPTSQRLHGRWRYQQEVELKKRTGRGMTRKEIEQFVAVYQPFTYLCYQTIQPDVQLLVNARHKIYKMNRY